MVARVEHRTQGAHKGRPYGPITYQTDTGSELHDLLEGLNLRLKT